MLSLMVGNKWICDGNYSSVDTSKVPNILPSPFIYEVIRVKNGKAVFLTEHLDRMKKSFELMFGQSYDIVDDKMRISAYELINQLHIENNNIRIVAWQDIYGKSDDKHPSITWRIYPIKSNYPDEKMYAEGVKVSSYLFERPDPEAKVYYTDMKQEVADICKNTGVFEVLLTKDNGEWTEGSRSNLFFISGDKVYSAKSDDILHGITRMKLLEVLKILGVELVEKSIDSKCPQKFEAGFLTGTSIHVLPIYSVDGHVYDSASNELVQKIAKKFEELITTEYGK